MAAPSRLSGVRAAAVVALAMGALTAAGGTAAASDPARTVVFRDRLAGQVAQAVWTSCPAPSVGRACTDVYVLAADARSVSGRYRDRTPVLRVLTFVYRVVEGDGGEPAALPVAEWFGRLEGADVQGSPRLERTVASGVVPIQVCDVLDPSTGLTCPARQRVVVSWTGDGPLRRIAEHTVRRERLRLENTWTRGWQRAATAVGTVDGVSPGALLSGELLRVDQGQIVVQHPIG